MFAVSSISQRLNDANERAVILGIMADAKTEIEWDKDCSSVLDGIIGNSNKIVKYLTQGEVSSCVDSCFTAANPLHAVPVLVSALSSSDSVDRVIYWLTLSVRQRLEQTLKDATKTGIDDFLYQKYSEFVNSLVFLRERLLNAINKDKTHFRTSESLRVIESSMCSALTSSLQHVYDSIVAEEDVDLRVLSLLVAKSRTIVITIRRNGDMLDVFVGLKKLLLQRKLTNKTYIGRVLLKKFGKEEESAIWDRIAQRIFTDDSIGTRDSEALIIEVALFASKTDDLMRCFGLSIRRNPIVHRVCCTKLFLQRVCEPSLVMVLTDYLHTAATKEMYVQAMEKAVSIWSDVSHVRYVAVEQQMHLTRVILGLGRWINEMNASHMWRKLFDIAIKGVELRLANPDVTIRQSGMFVGETFSGWMGGERLEFEYSEDPWLIEMRRIRDGVAEAPASVDKCEQTPPPLECDDVQLPSSSSAVAVTQVVDSDDEEDFPAYEVPESEKKFEVLSDGAEPEKKAPAPYYIRDCYEQLSEKEKFEVFEAAFFALNEMIRRKAIGFVDIASNLVKKLVFLEDKFSTKGFEDVRKQCIISCLVMRPEIAPKLGDMVFARSCSFFHRYLILECFAAAAKELAEFPSEPAPKKVVEISKKNKKEEPDDWRAVVEARIRSHTRRFTSEQKPEFTAPSRFAPVATLFFYPLLRTQTEEHLELKGRDSPFLARLIFCLSDILQKAANAPTVVKMATSLAEVVAPLKFHPDAFIRSSVLFAYFSISVAVPDGVFFELFGNLVRGWIEWTTMCADDVDASEQQRNLAGAVTATLLQKIEATNTIEESRS